MTRRGDIHDQKDHPATQVPHRVGVGDLPAAGGKAAPQPQVVGANGTVTYTVTIENIGTLAATGVTFTDTSITGGTYVFSTLNGNNVGTADTNYWATKQYVSDPSSTLAAAGYTGIEEMCRDWR